MAAGELGRVSVRTLGTEGGENSCELEDRSGGQWWLFAGRERERVDGTKNYSDKPIES